MLELHGNHEYVAIKERESFDIADSHSGIHDLEEMMKKPVHLKEKVMAWAVLLAAMIAMGAVGSLLFV